MGYCESMNPLDIQNPFCKRGIPVICLEAEEMYDGKSVLCKIEKRTESVAVSGHFRVHVDKGCTCVFIEIADPEGVSLIKVPQSHIDSVVPASSADVPEVDFVVKRLFEYRHYNPNI